MLLRSLDQIKNIKFDLLICDEGHRLKNSAIKTTTALISLACEKRIILTGQYLLLGGGDGIAAYGTYTTCNMMLSIQRIHVLNGVHANKPILIKPW